MFLHWFALVDCSRLFTTTSLTAEVAQLSRSNTSDALEKHYAALQISVMGPNPSEIGELGQQVKKRIDRFCQCTGTREKFPS